MARPHRRLTLPAPSPRNEASDARKGRTEGGSSEQDKPVLRGFHRIRSWLWSRAQRFIPAKRPLQQADTHQGVQAPLGRDDRVLDLQSTEARRKVRPNSHTPRG